MNPSNSAILCAIGISAFGENQIPPRGVESIALSDARCLSLHSPGIGLSSFSHVGNAGSTPAGITNSYAHQNSAMSFYPFRDDDPACECNGLQLPAEQTSKRQDFGAGGLLEAG